MLLSVEEPLLLMACVPVCVRSDAALLTCPLVACMHARMRMCVFQHGQAALPVCHTRMCACVLSCVVDLPACLPAFDDRVQGVGLAEGRKGAVKWSQLLRMFAGWWVTAACCLGSKYSVV